MKEVNLSKSAWHTKFYKWATGKSVKWNNLCPYFWSLVSLLLISSLILLWKIVKTVFNGAVSGVKYVDSVLNEEWPLIRISGANPKTAEAIKNFFTSLDNINPKDGKDIVVYSKILDRSDEVAKLRNARLFSVQNDLPAAFYFVSLFSILGVLLICSLRLVEATAMRVFALTIQIVMLTIMFSAVLVIDLPYLGDTVSSPEPIVLIHESMKKRVGLHNE